MQLRFDLYRRLINILAELFIDMATIQAIILPLELSMGHIDFDTRSINTWTSVIAAAEKEGKLLQLLTLCTDRKKNPLLLSLQEQITKDGFEQRDHLPVSYADYEQGTPVKIACIYEPPLTRELKKLSDQLAISRQERLLELYDWLQEPGGLTCQIALVFMTPGLLGSQRPYFRCVEGLAAKGAKVIPLLIRPCDWEGIKVFRGKVPLPKNGKFAADKNHWPDEDSAYLDMALGVKRVAEKIKAHKQ